METTYAKLESQELPADRFYVLSGDERRLMHPVIDRIRAWAVGDGAGFDEEAFDGKSANAATILASAQTIPFDAPRRLVVVTNAQRLAISEAEAIARAIGHETKKKTLPTVQLPNTSCLLLICDEEADDDAQRKTKPVVTLLEAAAKACATLIRFPALKGDDAARRLRKAAELAGKRLSLDAARHLLELVDGDFSVAAAELEKALLFVEPRQDVTEFDLDSVVTPAKNARIFMLVDSVVEGRLAEALSQIRMMLGGGERPETVAMRSVLPLIARQLRLLWQARALMDRGWGLTRSRNAPDEIAALLPDDSNVLNLIARQPYFEPRIRKQAERLTLDQLRDALRAVMDADLALKGMAPCLDAADTLERMVIHLCDLVRKPEPASRYQ